ncbi:MAG: methionyl-tRNA formyltransferase [Verrucomicrobiota bacterium]
MYVTEKHNINSLKVCFLGSGAIGIPVLDSLMLGRDIEVAACISQPDKPAGRNRQSRATPLADFAERKKLEVKKPESVNTPEFREYLTALQVDIVVVMAFGQILKKSLLELPPFGCFNVHASLLPRHRGASPLENTIMNGDAETGVSFMKMDEGVDTGPVYQKFRTELSGEETTGELETRLAYLAAGHVNDCLRKIYRDSLSPVPQDENRATYTQKLHKKDAEINWTENSKIIERKIRAFFPRPKAYTNLPSGRKNNRLQITNARACAQDRYEAEPAEIVQADQNGWLVQCGQGLLQILRVLPEGKREMPANEFLRGASIKPGIKMGERAQES